MKAFILGLVFVLLGACAHRPHEDHKHGHQAPAAMEKGELGGTNYNFRSKTYFMGAPTEATFDQAKKQGVTTVINLRTEEEMKAAKFDEGVEVKARGLNYYHFPIDSKKPLSKETFAQIETAFMSHHSKGEKVIVHCASGQRAGAWFAYHIRKAHGESAQQSLKEAEEVGLTSEPLSEKVKLLIQ